MSPRLTYCFHRLFSLLLFIVCAAGLTVPVSAQENMNQPPKAELRELYRQIDTAYIRLQPQVIMPG